MTRTIAVALDGAGWHPAAWREPDARPHELFRPKYWRDLVVAAERGGVDFVTIEDSLGLQTPPFGVIDAEQRNEVRGRLDALLIAAYVAPLTKRIGLIPTVTTTHTEPFHVATAIQSLDYASRGRAGWRPQVSASPADAELFGRTTLPLVGIDQIKTPAGAALLERLFSEAHEVIEVVRRLWDSWEDDAIIRDVATGRFIDRDKLHYVDFAGEYFSVKGPSITPRAPQGQPLVTVLAHDLIPFDLAARDADIAYLTPATDEQASHTAALVRAAEEKVGRVQPPLHLYADVVVLIEKSTASARAALERLDATNGEPLASDALIFAGTAAELRDLIERWTELGYEGFRLRPARLPHDLVAITDELIPLLARDTENAQASTLRERLGFERARNRYATAASSTKETAA